MAMADLIDLFSYWRETPPVHEILCAVYKIGCDKAKVSQKSQTIAGDPSGISELIRRFPNGFVTGA